MLTCVSVHFLLALGRRWAGPRIRCGIVSAIDSDSSISAEHFPLKSSFEDHANLLGRAIRDVFFRVEREFIPKGSLRCQSRTRQVAFVDARIDSDEGAGRLIIRNVLQLSAPRGNPPVGCPAADPLHSFFPSFCFSNSLLFA